jgi:hypothetical protein
MHRKGGMKGQTKKPHQRGREKKRYKQNRKITKEID